MQQFSIRDIENMSGIKAHTLRIWEKRYSFFSSKRTTGGHRYYDNEDLKKLLRIAFLNKSGWKVSRIERLNADRIKEEVEKYIPGSGGYEQYILRLIEAAIDFNEVAFNHILEESFSACGFEKAVRLICYPFLTRVGMLWMTNNVIPAQEHFSSYQIQHKIIAHIDRLPPVPQGKGKIVLFTPKGEFHELPLLYLHYMFLSGGWNSVYLGSNISMEQLHPVITEDVDYLFLHLVTNFTGFSGDEYLERLCQTFPRQTIVATGAALQDVKRNFINLKILYDDDQVTSFIRK